MRHLTASVFILIVLGFTVPGFAQGSEPALYAGIGVRSQPAYDGSASQQLSVIPLLRVYGRPWFVRTTQGVFELGVQKNLRHGVAVGGQVVYEPGRDAADSPVLEGLPDRGMSASFGPHLEVDAKLFGLLPINLLGRIRKNAVWDRGTNVDGRFSAGLYGNRYISLGAFVQGTWADLKSAKTNYGVSATDAVHSSLPEFQPRPGLVFVSVGLLGSINVKREWFALWSVDYRRLQADSARSPLTEHKSNVYVSAGIAHRF